LSLKIFHIIFITASIILCFWFGIWSLHYYLSGERQAYLMIGIASLVIAVLLVVYETLFIRKTKQGLK